MKEKSLNFLKQKGKKSRKVKCTITHLIIKYYRYIIQGWKFFNNEIGKYTHVYMCICLYFNMCLYISILCLSREKEK